MAWSDPHSMKRHKTSPHDPDLPIGAGEEAWIEVVQKMDEVYADLVTSQTLLEKQNARLEEAQTFISSVLAAMTDVLIVCDLKGRIQQVNPALEKLLGRREAELAGLPLTEIFEAASHATATAFPERVQKDGQLADCEVSLVDAEGHAAPLAMNCTARRDHRGRLAGMVLVGRPVGELRRAYRELDLAHQQLTQTQQQLVASEKMAALGRLVAGVAHELNNPISFVFGNMHALKRYGIAITRYLEACERRQLDPELRALREELKIDRVVRDITPLVEGTLEGAERVSDIVQDLRRFSSSQEETQEGFDLVKLIRTASDWVIKAERVKPAVRFDLPESLEMVGRKGHLHQIIVNLVQNAADVLAGRDDGAIEIAARRRGDDILVEVADNGSGIAAGDLDKIFEPFFTTKPLGQGTGLGLYVSYSMAQKHGGDLTAANRPGGGALFTLRIPDHGPAEN